jgi:hypothetical protein
MKENVKRYIRVGTDYYKLIYVPLSSGDKLITLSKWKYEILLRDYTREDIESIPKLDGFCVYPDHINYKKIINGTFYNKYLPLKVKPKPGNCETILDFIKHIFGDQFPLGITYLQVLYLYPKERLPILALVSSQRETGKSTFLYFLKQIFDANMSILNNEDLRSNFTSQWISKILLAVDETFLDKKEDSERLKNLSTAKFYKHEAKGQDKYDVEFFGKFILCSNNEDNFISIDQQETRYWVRKIPVLKQKDDLILDKIKKEIPAFLHYLTTQKLYTEKKGRMWFTTEQIKTEALLKLKKNNRGRMEREMLNMIEYIMDTEGIQEVKICPKDVIDWLKYSGFRNPTFSHVKHLLKVNWDLQPEDNSLSYTGYHFDYTGTILSSQRKGRYYTISREFISNFND